MILWTRVSLASFFAAAALAATGLAWHSSRATCPLRAEPQVLPEQLPVAQAAEPQVVAEQLPVAEAGEPPATDVAAEVDDDTAGAAGLLSGPS
jgi:hypothetical protein